MFLYYNKYPRPSNTPHNDQNKRGPVSLPVSLNHADPFWCVHYFGFPQENTQHMPYISACYSLNQN